jgi:hypothetical protein
MVLIKGEVMNKKLMALIACVSIIGFGTYIYGASYAVLRGRVYSKIAELKQAGKSGRAAGELLKADYNALNDLLIKRNLVKATEVAMDRVKNRIINDLGKGAFDELGVPAPKKKTTKRFITGGRELIEGETITKDSDWDTDTMGEEPAWHKLNYSKQEHYENAFTDDEDGLLEEAVAEALKKNNKAINSLLVGKLKQALGYAKSKKDSDAESSIQSQINSLK